MWKRKVYYKIEKKDGKNVKSVKIIKYLEFSLKCLSWVEQFTKKI